MSKTQEEINQFWSEDAEDYDKIIQEELAGFRVEAWQNYIGKLTGNQKGLKILDCGCGPAFFTIILAKAGYQMTAVDGAEGMLAKARKNIREQQVDAEILAMDCHALEFEDNTFDVVVSRNVTHALRDHRQVYQEWKRVLKPDGILLIFDANWHLPYAYEDMRQESLRRWKECIRVYGSDFNGNTAYEEEKAEVSQPEKHVLGTKIRPQWDCELLRDLEYSQVSCQEGISDFLWDEKEKLLYGNTPMFCVKAVK